MMILIRTKCCQFFSGNQHAPYFNQSTYEEYISPDVSRDYPFLYVRASDADDAQCETHCPCSEVQYSLDGGKIGGKIHTFVIDSKTGGLGVALGAHLVASSVHRLKVYARNGNDRLMEGSVEVVVRVSDPKDQSVKLRKLQSSFEVGVNISICCKS